jgi:hypothetical protein
VKFSSYYNNLGINSFAIASVLNRSGLLTLPKVALILPIVAHRGMVSQLAYGRFKVVSFEQYLIENIGFFYNFDERYTASITPTVNALQFLIEIGVVQLLDDCAVMVAELPIASAMGNRAKQIDRASTNIAALVSGSAEIFYLNARIKL